MAIHFFSSRRWLFLEINERVDRRKDTHQFDKVPIEKSALSLFVFFKLTMSTRASVIETTRACFTEDFIADEDDENVSDCHSQWISHMVSRDLQTE